MSAIVWSLTNILIFVGIKQITTVTDLAQGQCLMNLCEDDDTVSGNFLSYEIGITIALPVSQDCCED